MTDNIQAPVTWFLRVTHDGRQWVGSSGKLLLWVLLALAPMSDPLSEEQITNSLRPFVPG